MMERKKSLLREAPDDLRKQIFKEIRELVEKKQTLEEMCKDRRNAKMEEGREKRQAEGDVTRTAASGTRTSG